MYRPPDCSMELFKDALEKVDNASVKTLDNNSKVERVYLMGDFNFPENDWANGAHPQGKSAEALQTMELLEVTEKHFLTNVVKTPTRGSNILDLMFVREETDIVGYETEIDPKLSDHNVLIFNLNENDEVPDRVKYVNHYLTDLIKYNVEDASKEEWEVFTDRMENTDMDFLKAMDVDSQVDYLYQALEDAARAAFSIKERFTNKPKRRYIPQEVRKLLRRKSKLSKRILSKSNWVQNMKIMEELEDVTVALDEMYLSRRRDMEAKAISRMKSDPSYFYKYQRRFAKTSESIPDLKITVNDKVTVVSDDYGKAEALRRQYESVWSSPDSQYVIGDSLEFFHGCSGCKEDRVHICEEDIFMDAVLNNHMEEIINIELNHSSKPCLSDIVFTTDRMEEVLNDIKNSSATGPDGVPGRMLKGAKKAIARILCVIGRSSMDCGYFPQRLKQMFILGFHKGGPKDLPAQYRPIALSSHIAKALERVVRVQVIDYMVAYKMFDQCQHGSISGRSTVSQLLVHHYEIVEGLSKGGNVDCVYIDFAKAYNKVDHGILAHKLKDLGITGNLGA
jgi:hypothetical protein